MTKIPVLRRVPEEEQQDKKRDFIAGLTAGATKG